MAHFFIDRPIFAWVLFIMTVSIGIYEGTQLPIAQYPEIAPPSVTVTAVYPGASAETIEESVTQIIEQDLIGLDGFRYMVSESSGSGVLIITLTFEQGTDPDIAQVQVQNKLQTALTKLPSIVQNQGIQVSKSSSTFLMIVGFHSPDNSLSRADLGDYVSASLMEPISRLKGIGGTTLFGSGYAMNIWLDPMKLYKYNMTSLDVVQAIRDQNRQATLGDLGAMPAAEGQVLSYNINAQALLESEAEFREIQLRVNEDGSKVLLQDVARVELSAEDEQFIASYNGQASLGIAINLASGANALDTAKRIRNFIEESSYNYPHGMEYIFPYDTTPFIEVSINNVIKTLIEAILLVFLVMYVFLKSFRSAFIPLLAVPYVLTGTLAIMAALGFILNTLTLFAMVLAIGLLVDDAIVVVENVERLIEEEDLTPYEAAKKTMDEIVGALIGIGFVLSAVFVPMAFIPGATGIIYRQFSITIITAMVLSVIVAIIFTPAMCATILQSKADKNKPSQGIAKVLAILFSPILKLIRGFIEWFDRFFTKSNAVYEKGVHAAITKPKRYLLVLVVVLISAGFLFQTIPSSFLPEEDQGFALGQIILPQGVSANVSEEALQSLTHYVLTEETESIESIFTVAGFSFTGRGPDQALFFVMMKPWEERTESIQTAVGRIFGFMERLPLEHNAFGFAFVPPAIPELGLATGVEFYLQDSLNLGREELLSAVDQLSGHMAAQPELFDLRTLQEQSMRDKAEFYVDIDRERAHALQIPTNLIYDSLSVGWGGLYVNDFVDRGRMKKVQVQSDAKFRMMPEDFKRWYVRNTKGEMVPFSAFAVGKWSANPPQIDRFNGHQAYKLQVSATHGRSTGEVMAEIENIVKTKLPQGFQVEWSGVSYEEKQTGNIQAALFAVSVFVIFLSLAALYESWSIPFAVLLTIPVGVVGAIFMARSVGLENDVYFQVGMLTTIGLTAKNAILIVEFAREIMQEGKGIIEATVRAAHLRLRPIMMTSIAFGLGVLPLAFSTGAGAASQNVVGRTVIGGMIAGTFLVIFFAPIFFRLIVGRSKP